jgi:hypothetical protein
MGIRRAEHPQKEVVLTICITAERDADGAIIYNVSRNSDPHGVDHDDQSLRRAVRDEILGPFIDGTLQTKKP